MFTMIQLQNDVTKEYKYLPCIPDCKKISKIGWEKIKKCQPRLLENYIYRIWQWYGFKIIRIEHDFIVR